MIDLSVLPHNRFHILGYGVTGASAALALSHAGKQVSVWDDTSDKRDKARADGYEVSSSVNADVLVVSPGIIALGSKAHNAIKEAREKRVEINNDIGLFRAALPSKKLIGITGTNGKSTTTALTHHILQEAGLNAEVGGNLGMPALSLRADADIYVLELSSYQLETAPFLKPDVAVLLNITPDHIDHHGTMEAYIAAKMRLFADAGLSINASLLDYGRSEYEGYNLKTLERLKGAHNWQNIAAAFEACKAMGLSSEIIWQGVRSFPGLPHRQFLVRRIGSIEYVNDSKATNADATQKALRSFNNIHLIAGGLSKEGGLNGLEEDFKSVRKTYLIGKAQDEFAHWLDARGFAYELCGTMDVAIEEAHREAQKQGGAATVLLSPACASWDQFTSFEDRGRQFEEKVKSL